MNTEHLQVSFQIIQEAIDLAMQGKFPAGLKAARAHVKILEALENVSAALRDAYEHEEDPEPQE